ncbi:hypothetical protein ACFLZX_04595 [Nanoarchaeota archaeon]
MERKIYSPTMYDASTLSTKKESDLSSEERALLISEINKKLEIRTRAILGAMFVGDIRALEILVDKCGEFSGRIRPEVCGDVKRGDNYKDFSAVYYEAYSFVSK